MDMYRRLTYDESLSSNKRLTLVYKEFVNISKLYHFHFPSLYSSDKWKGRKKNIKECYDQLLSVKKMSNEN